MHGVDIFIEVRYAKEIVLVGAMLQLISCTLSPFQRFMRFEVVLHELCTTLPKTT